MAAGGGFGLLAGPGLAAVLLCLSWRRQGYRFPTHAGEWLLLISGAYAVLVTLHLLTERALWGSMAENLRLDDEAFARYVTLTSAMICGMLTLLVAALTWVAFAFLREHAEWRVSFLLVAVMLLIATSVVLPTPWQFQTNWWLWGIRATAIVALNDYQSFVHLAKWRVTLLCATMAAMAGLAALAWAACARAKRFPAWRLFFGQLAFLLAFVAALTAVRALDEWSVGRPPDHEALFGLLAAATIGFAFAHRPHSWQPCFAIWSAAACPGRTGSASVCSFFRLASRSSTWLGFTAI